MKKYFIFIPLLFLGIILPWKSVFAFCGFYVAKADASLYNEVSRVVFVRNEDKTVLTLMNDYKGKLKDFALVVPVPVILKKEQIHIGDSKVVDHLDAFTAPRLVEYFDENPCYREYLEEEKAMVMDGAPSGGSKNKDNKGSGVTVEASYTVGEYDIVILSAKYSNGLENWLRSNKYKIPKGASKALAPYIKQKMKFFVAKVNLKNQANTGLQFLRPLQFAFNSEKFMLPIRLGMINANGPQELLVYMISKNGRVETSNYRNVKIPSDMEIPLYVKNDFANFYKSMFNNQARKENRKVTFTEYFWDMSWCDPCAAEPLSREELSSLGVFWLNEGNKG
ncbi:MAG: DUF2330 domain-containing protein, partial [Leptospiraceae bacterium]|nr:DUF2330 domain-containing protein [Leptospiraceae bacterium]